MKANTSSMVEYVTIVLRANRFEIPQRNIRGPSQEAKQKEISSDSNAPLAIPPAHAETGSWLCNNFTRNLPQRNGLSRYGAGFALPSLSAMSPIAKRPLRRHPTSAKRDRWLPSQVPLVSIHINQRYWPFHTQRPIRSNRNLYCRNRRRLCRRIIQYFIRHKTPLISAHW